MSHWYEWNEYFERRSIAIDEFEFKAENKSKMTLYDQLRTDALAIALRVNLFIYLNQ